ncbi:SGNH/GDSL hydrolase family protein [Flavobacterium pectinovorum]|uniref:SGNH/GDSL hydrolase family protein n=1 Tax=Flavobacterium pectinovorum TaxID=29533 RepID=A0A502ESJ5_9FLAO|nr:SGNH/GDSL hydrolase family protein [Flavobacterium pectinovorum]TPG40084.1 SGNH/GDSL hydrolase family protein [Flavobacterium pectinovorum]
MRILFLTDSLSLPRKYEGGEVNYEDTYISLVREKYPQALICDFAMGGGRITDLLGQCFYYKQFKPDLVFIHCGIVDCAPRSFSLSEKLIIEKLRLRGITKLFDKRLRNLRNCTYTKKDLFLNTLLNIKRYFADVPLYSIGILQICDEYEKLVPGIKKNAGEYNKILSANTKFIDNDNFPIDAIISDFHHLNEKGHTLIFEKLKCIVELHNFSNSDNNIS